MILIEFVLFGFFELTVGSTDADSVFFIFKRTTNKIYKQSSKGIVYTAHEHTYNRIQHSHNAQW